MPLRICHVCVATVNNSYSPQLYMAGLDDLGDAMSGSLETTLKGTFHPTLTFGENRMILEQSEVELAL